MFDAPNNGEGWHDGGEFESARRGYYAILRGHDVVPCDDTMVWGRWFETANRRVAETYLGSAWVSTVFLGLNHNHLGRGRPLWFETMVFRDGNRCKKDVYQERCTTWAEAEAMHARGVKRERASFPAWMDGDDGLKRVQVVGYGDARVELENGDNVSWLLVYRNRRRVPLMLATYKRRFAA